MRSPLVPETVDRTAFQHPRHPADVADALDAVYKEPSPIPTRQRLQAVCTRLPEVQVLANVRPTAKQLAFMASLYPHWMTPAIQVAYLFPSGYAVEVWHDAGYAGGYHPNDASIVYRVSNYSGNHP